MICIEERTRDSLNANEGKYITNRSVKLSHLLDNGEGNLRDTFSFPYKKVREKVLILTKENTVQIEVFK